MCHRNSFLYYFPTKKPKASNPMKLIRYREGYACNSSSTHSIIFFDTPGRSDSQLNNSYDRWGFGWQWFTAVTPKAKLMYGIACFKQLLNHIYPYSASSYIFKNKRYSKNQRDDMYRYIIKVVIDSSSDQTLKDLYKTVTPEEIDQTYIDHQSMPTLPLARNEKNRYHTKFIQDFLGWIIRAPIAILGGNDNDEYGDYSLDETKNYKIYRLFTLCFPIEQEPGFVIANDNEYTIFTPEYRGTKARKVTFTFELDVETPNLLDIKHEEVTSP